jgi:hypothetical protein
VAWLGLIETDSILIREKRKHLSKQQTGCLEMILECKHLRIESMKVP